jgi:hypothetical protein
MIFTKFFVEYLLQPVFSYIIFPITRIAVNAMENVVFVLLSPSTPSVVFWFSIIFLPMIFLCYYNLPFNNAAVVIDRVERLGKDRFRESESPEDTEELRLLDQLYGRHDFLRHLYLLPPTRLGIAINSLQVWRQIWNTPIAKLVFKILVAGWITVVEVWDHIRGQDGRYCRHVVIGCECFTAKIQPPGARTYGEIVQDATKLTEQSDILTRERDTVIEENNRLRRKMKELADHRKHCQETHQAFRSQDINLRKIDNLQAERDRLYDDNRQLTAKLADMGRNGVPRTVEKLKDAYVSARDNYQKHTDSLTAALVESETQIATLKDDILKLKKDLEMTRQGELLSINQRLEREISTLGKKLFDDDRRYNKELQLKDEEIQGGSLRLLLRLDDGGQTRLRQLDALLKKRDKDLAQCITDRDRFEKDAKERAEEIERIKNEILHSEPVHLQGLLNNAYKELAEKDERLNALEFLSRVEDNVEAVEKECAERQAELQAVIDDRDRQISVFHEQIDVAWNNLDWPADKFENRDKYTAFVDGACLEIKRQQDDIWKMQYQIRQVGGQLDVHDLDIRLQDMRDEDNKYRDEARNLRESLKETERTVAVLLEDRERLQGIEEAWAGYERNAQMDTQDVPLSWPPLKTPSGRRLHRRRSSITLSPDYSPSAGVRRDNRSPTFGRRYPPTPVDNQDDSTSTPEVEYSSISGDYFTIPKSFDIKEWNVIPTATTFRISTKTGHPIVYEGVSAIVALIQSISSQKPGDPLGEASNLSLLEFFEDRYGKPPDTGHAYDEFQVADILWTLSGGQYFLETVTKKRGAYNEANAYTSRSLKRLSSPTFNQLVSEPVYLFLNKPDIWQIMIPVHPPEERDQLPETQTVHQWDGPTPFQPPPGYDIDEDTPPTYESLHESGRMILHTNVSSINALLSSVRSQYPDSLIGSASPDILHKRLQELFPTHTGEYGIEELQTLLSDSTQKPLYVLRVVEPGLDGQAKFVSTIEVFGSPLNPEKRPELLIFHTGHELNAPWKGITYKKEVVQEVVQEVVPPLPSFPTYHEIVTYDLDRNFDITGWKVTVNHAPEVNRFADLAQALMESFFTQYVLHNGAIRARLPFPEWRDAIAQGVPIVGPIENRISIEHNALQQVLHRETSNAVRLIRVQAVVEGGIKNHCRFSLKSCAPTAMPSICADVYMFVDHDERWQSMAREVEKLEQQAVQQHLDQRLQQYMQQPPQQPWQPPQQQQPQQYGRQQEQQQEEEEEDEIT